MAQLYLFADKKRTLFVTDYQLNALLPVPLKS